jgi:hypothetical protein
VVLGGGAADLRLGSGDRKGPDCFSNLSEGSPSPFPVDLLSNFKTLKKMMETLKFKIL